MSHSQFHSTNLFILRHAWLNLWDKHMTTGRINQVTTIQFLPNEWQNHPITHSRSCFYGWEFISKSWFLNPNQRKQRYDKPGACSCIESKDWNCLVPRSHKFWTGWPMVTEITRVSRPWWKLPIANLNINWSIAMADFQVVNCIRFSHRQVIHIRLPVQAQKDKAFILDFSLLSCDK